MMEKKITLSYDDYKSLIDENEWLKENLEEIKKSQPVIIINPSEFGPSLPHIVKNEAAVLWIKDYALDANNRIHFMRSEINKLKHELKREKKKTWIDKLLNI